MNSPEYMNPCCMIYSRVYEGFWRCLSNDWNKEEANDKYENDLFVFQFDNYQNMLFCMMTYIQKPHCAWVKIYYENLVQHRKAIIKGDESKEIKTVTAKGGRKINWR